MPDRTLQEQDMVGKEVTLIIHTLSATDLYAAWSGDVRGRARKEDPLALEEVRCIKYAVTNEYLLAPASSVLNSIEE